MLIIMYIVIMLIEVYIMVIMLTIVYIIDHSACLLLRRM